jgi:hypothetical protein
MIKLMSILQEIKTVPNIRHMKLSSILQEITISKPLKIYRSAIDIDIFEESSNEQEFINMWVDRWVIIDSMKDYAKNEDELLDEEDRLIAEKIYNFMKDNKIQMLIKSE